MRPSFVASLAFGLAALSGRRCAAQASDTVRWTVLDSTMVWPKDGGCCYGLSGLRIAVRGSKRVDTLQAIVRIPSQLPGRRLLLPVITPEQAIVLNVYDASTGTLRPIAPPRDYDPRRTDIAFHSGRRLLAYLVHDTLLVVRRFPQWDLVARSKPIARCDDDLMLVVWRADGAYVYWAPPKCTDATPDRDSLAVPN